MRMTDGPSLIRNPEVEREKADAAANQPKSTMKIAARYSSLAACASRQAQKQSKQATYDVGNTPPHAPLRVLAVPNI